MPAGDTTTVGAAGAVVIATVPLADDDIAAVFVAVIGIA
jgi:hypothetical protein